MKIEVLRRSLFAQNERAAEHNRRLLDDHGVIAVNVLGGAGCGKTTLLEGLIPPLRSGYGVAVLEGDVATTKDAARIAALEVPVIQLLTEGGCHLTASLVQEGLRRLPLEEIDLLLIENVGNPICPANFDLGEHLRIAVLSVTEGDDKPAKYPYLFKVADAVVFTKLDLKDATHINAHSATAANRAQAPHNKIFSTSKPDPSSLRPLVGWIVSKLPGHG